MSALQLQGVSNSSAEALFLAKISLFKISSYGRLDVLSDHGYVGMTIKFKFDIIWEHLREILLILIGQ